MSVNHRVTEGGNQVTITVTDRFDFSVHREFREAYRAGGGPGVTYSVDLGSTEYMDSSALGMLLLLKEHAGGERASVVIRRAPPGIRKILEIANFHKLFAIE